MKYYHYQCVTKFKVIELKLQFNKLITSVEKSDLWSTGKWKITSCQSSTDTEQNRDGTIEI